MLGYLNYQKHPNDRSRRVFYYRYEDLFNVMQQHLNEKSIQFETQIDDDGTQTYYVIVHKDDFDEAFNCNTQTMMSIKKPFIASPELRYFLIIILAVGLGIALVGYIITNLK